MKQIKSNTLLISSVLSIIICSASNSFADDIDIYKSIGRKDAQNNVLFMIDNSGSMRNISGSTTRFEHVKIGMGDVLGTLDENVKVGIGIYNGEGASIIHPIKRLGDITSRESKNTIILTEDDGYETDSNNVYNDTSYLSFGTHQVSPSNFMFNSYNIAPLVSAVIGDVVSVESYVNSMYDDAYQCTSGENYTYYKNNVIFGGNNYYCNDGTFMIGSTIFRNVNIPKGATIKNAYVEYSSSAKTNGKKANVELRVESSVFPLTFSWHDTRDIISRTFNADEKVTWKMVGGQKYAPLITPDISNLIQVIVNQDTWNQASNGINIALYPSSGRNDDFIPVFSYYGSSYRAPKLVVEYVMEEVIEESAHNLVGLNFKNVDIASYSDIQQGQLEVVAGDTVIGGGDLTIKIVDPLDAGEITDLSKLSTRNVIAQKTVNLPEWNFGTAYSFDIKDIITSAFNRDTWCGGNDLTIILESNSLSSIKSVDADGDFPNKLYVKQGESSDNSCFVDTLTYEISNRLNDSDNSSSTRYNYRLGDGVKSGLRFENIRVSNNDQIIDSYLELTAYSTFNKDYDLTVSADVSNNNNPLNFNRYYAEQRVENRTNLIGSQNTTLKATENDRKTLLTGIKDTIISVVSRPDWQEGNSIALIIDDNTLNSGYAEIVAYDRNISHQRTKLHIKVKKHGKDISPTVRENIIDLVYGLDTSGGTPTLGSTIEAYQYFIGDEVINGVYRDRRTNFVSHPETWTDGVLNTPDNCSTDDYTSYACSTETISGNPIYKSPMSAGFCETNSIIMMTDGEPNDQQSSRLKNGVNVWTAVKNITGKTCYNNWDCINKITSHMANNDIRPDLDGTQNIFTNVIGFGELASKTQLEEYAASGKGNFYTVEDSASLSETITVVLDNVMDIEATITMPGVSVDQSNRLKFKNDLYYSVFKPSSLKSWNGNLKKYRIKNTGTKENPEFNIVDTFENNAVNTNTGFFNEDSTSIWSSIPDGGDSSLGGAASLLRKSRNLFTYTTDNLYNTNMTGTNFKLDRTNTLLTKEMFNITGMSDNDFLNFLDWVDGLDVKDEDEDGLTNEPRAKMSDPLHGKPIVVPYNDNNATVFISTNEGILHGFDANTGEELFGFVPKRLLPNLYNRYKNDIGEHQYGLDLTWVAYRHDEGNDGIMGNDINDFTYLYGGMRRGGDSLYALDVTNMYHDNVSSARVPKFLWEINPSKGSAYENMGQTWSIPVLARIKLNGQEKIVVIFGGGYDTKNDDEKNVNYDFEKGNQIYMVDAKTGELIWWASGSNSSANLKMNDMKYSIATKPSLIDLDSDGYLDYIYVNDMGGQVFKIKIDNQNTGASNLAKGVTFAKLGKTDFANNGLSNDRKFYERLLVVPVIDSKGKSLYIVSGSGLRASPTAKTVKDGMFVMRDEDVLLGKFDIQKTPIKTTNLLDVTKTKDENQIVTDLQEKDGYAIWLNDGKNPSDDGFQGEKVLGDLVVFNNSLIFTTYVPDEKNVSCEFMGIGGSRKYQIDILTGAPSNQKNIENGDTVNEERYSKEVLPGISSGAKIIYTEDGVVAITNTSIEKLDDINGLGFIKNRWLRKNNETTDQVPNHILQYRNSGTGQ